MQALKTALEALKKAESNVAESSEELKTDTESPLKNISRIENISAEEIAKLRQKKKQHIRLFDTEEVDPYWAYETQDNLREALSEGTTQYHIEDVSCKTSVCKLQLRPHTMSDDTVMTLGMSTSIKLMKSDKLPKMRTYFNMSENSEIVEIYAFNEPDEE